jgi:O-antigen/teichoic acid export membrane protein
MRYVSGNRKEDAAKLFCNYMKIGYYSVWILGTAVLITSKQVISMLYTEEYVQGNTVFVIYVIDSMIKFASMHLILTAGGKSKTIMTYSIISLGLNLVLNILFYYLIGINGPALATLVTTALYTFMILWKSIKLIDVKWTDVFDVKDLISFALILAVTGAAFYGANYVLLHVGVHWFISMMVSAGGFCVVNLLINWKRISGTLRAVNELRA